MLWAESQRLETCATRTSTKGVIPEISSVSTCYYYSILLCQMVNSSKQTRTYKNKDIYINWYLWCIHCISKLYQLYINIDFPSFNIIPSPYQSISCCLYIYRHIIYTLAYWHIGIFNTSYTYILVQSVFFISKKICWECYNVVTSYSKVALFMEYTSYMRSRQILPVYQTDERSKLVTFSEASNAPGRVETRSTAISRVVHFLW